MNSRADYPKALEERFEIVGVAGTGGMATVLHAHDRRLGRPVALKLLAPELSAALGKERFSREVRLTARLVHPNIVPLFDSGEAEGRLYYVMPFIEGDTLKVRLEREGTRPVAEVLRVMADLAEALAYAHAVGIVHRDLKPGNVFWYGGHALLADFGIATVTMGTGVSEALTSTGMAIGTLPYMSPEQAEGSSAIDGRADLYSLGCLAFELLSGRTPFTAPSPIAMLAAHLTASAPDIRERRPEVPTGLAATLGRLLAKRPEDRPASAAALLALLREQEAPTGPTMTTAVPAAPPPGAAAAGPAEPPEVTDLCRKGRSLYLRGMHGGEGAHEKFRMARTYFESALAKQPDNPRALVGLADTVHVDGIRGFTNFDEACNRAADLRYRALAADDSAGEVHTSFGTVMLYWEDDFENGGSELRRGVELAPDHALGRRLYGAWLKMAGRIEEAVAEATAAVRLDSLAPFLHVGLADALMGAGRYDAAIGPLREALRLAPGYAAAHERLEMSCHRAGRHEEALDARRTLLGMRGAEERMALLEADTARDGWLVARERDLRREAEELLAKAEKQDPFVDARGSRQLSDAIVITLAEVGDWTRAMDWVERGYLRRPGRLRRVLTDLPYNRNGLAVDPRYARLLRTAGLGDLL
ncbi:MAG: protein kinase domain-containing protein [Gemmatimonadales bacterium]